ncbi:MAG: GrpB family protein [Acidimicrobiales bacterium]
MDSERLEELRQVLVHGPTPVTVVIADADPTWPAQYEAYAAALQSLLGERLLLVEHIGSTSVPGLAAKPVIDIAAGIEDPDDEPAYLPDLLTAGWELRVREPGHRCLHAEPAVQRSDGEPTLPANLHCCRPGSPEIGRYLLLRDRLRADPATRARYADLKRSLATRRWADMNLYADAKRPLIRELLAEPRDG